MALKNAKAVLSVALCACLLAGCGISGASASLPSAESGMGQGTDEGASASAPSASAPAVLQEETTAESPSESVVSDEDASIRKSDLASYTETLSRFFHSPIQSTKDIPSDYSLAFFLLYQTFESNGGGDYYTQNENFFWEIPESDILRTAEEYLGLSDLSVSDITEWPFGKPQDGVCYYTQETSLPYSDPLAIEAVYSEATGEASVSIKMRDSEFEDSSHQKSLLVYHFICTNRADGTAVYCLQSIASSETAPDETGENAVSDGLVKYTSIYDIPFVELDYDGSRNCLSLNGEPWVAGPGPTRFGDLCFSDGKILIIQCFNNEESTNFSWFIDTFGQYDEATMLPDETYNKLFTYAEGYTLYTDDGYQYTVEKR